MLEESMAQLIAAAGEVGGDVISAGGTGTYDLNSWATEIQAGSYALMDTAYGMLGLPFTQALSVLSTVISVSAGWTVADCGLKALGMDHGDPSVEGADVWFCSDEHLTFTSVFAPPGRRPGASAPGTRRSHRGVPRLLLRGRRRRGGRSLGCRSPGLVTLTTPRLGTRGGSVAPVGSCPTKEANSDRHHVHDRGRCNVQRWALRRGKQGRGGPGGPRTHPPGR